MKKHQKCIIWYFYSIIYCTSTALTDWLTGLYSPGSSCTPHRGQKKRGAKTQSIVEEGAKCVSLRHNEALKESYTVKDFRKGHLLLLRRMPHLRKYISQSWNIQAL